MKPQNSLGLLALILSGIMIGVMVKSAATFNKKEDPIEVIEHTDTYDYELKNIHDIVHQSVSTTYHDYIVVIDSGKVVGNGVIHVANCKCKK